MERKTIKTLYWIFTILFALFMLYGGITHVIATESVNKLLSDLGYPLYLNAILGVAKIFGAIVILQPKYKTLKEWAYAGFTFDVMGASASYFLNGDGFAATIFTLVFLVPLFLSYFLWKKVDK